MKNIRKKAILISMLPVLFAGACSKNTNSGNSGNSNTNTNSTCPTCPTPKVVDNAVNSSLKITYENGDEVSDTLHLLYDADITDGRTKKLKAVVTPSGASITFTSSDTSVASVTSAGLITALKANAYCTITAKSTNGYSRTFEVITSDITRFFGVSGTSITKVLDSEIENLTLPTGYTTVAAGAINSLDRVKRLTISEGYTTFANQGPERCNLPTYIEYLSIPSTLQNVGSSLWFCTPYLKEVDVAEGNTGFGVYDGKFLYSTSENAVTGKRNYLLRALAGWDGNITDEMITETGITTIGHFSFSGSQSLSDVVIPSSLSLNHWYTFASSSITSLSISKTQLSAFSTSTPWHIAKIFANCPNFESVKIYDEENENVELESYGNYSVSDGALYYTETDDNGTSDDTSDDVITNVTLVVGTKNGTIKEGTTILGHSSFLGRKFTSTTLKIPNTVTTIQRQVFMYSNLEKVYIPSSVTSISEGDEDYTTVNSSDNRPAAFLTLATFINGKKFIVYDLDFVTSTAIENKYTLFFRSNPNLVIYDGSETDRGTTNRFTLQGVRYNRFGYQFNITEEAFAAL